MGTGRLTPNGDQSVLQATRDLHNSFKAAFGSTCCRVLKKNDAREAAGYDQNCILRTAKAAEFSAALILDPRPELMHHIDWDYLDQKEGIIAARMKVVASRLFK